MTSLSAERRLDTSDAGGIQAQVFQQDTRNPRTSDSDSSSSSPVTERSSSSPSSPFSYLSRDSSVSVPSRASSHSEEQHDGRQLQQYQSHNNHAEHDHYADSDDIPAPTPQTRCFQEAFLALLSLLPAHRYPVSPSSPPLASTGIIPDADNVRGEEDEERDNHYKDSQSKDGDESRGETMKNRTDSDAHQGRRFGYG